MRANVPNEWLDMIEEKIYIDLEIRILNKRIKQHKQHPEKYEVQLRNKLNDLVKVKTFLRENRIKIDPPEKYNEDFVRYYYSCKLDGGYKEGYMPFWISAIKYKLKKRLNGG